MTLLTPEQEIDGYIALHRAAVRKYVTIARDEPQAGIVDDAFMELKTLERSISISILNIVNDRLQALKQPKGDDD